MNVKLILLLMAALVWPVSAWSANESRFQLERSGSGFVRLDRMTGDVSTCTDTGGKMVCEAAEEKGAAGLRGEIAGLRARIDELERRIGSSGQGAAAQSRDGLPSDEEFERGLGYMERFFRRFMGIIREIERDDQSPGMPNRT